MIVAGTDIVDSCFKSRAGHRGIKAARAQFAAWLAIAASSTWKTQEDVKEAHPMACVLKGGRVLFHIKAKNSFRLIALTRRRDAVLLIRFCGSPEEYARIDAQSV